MSEDAIVDLFRRFDKGAEGRMEKAKLVKVLQNLDSRGAWTEEQLEVLLNCSGASQDTFVKYEDFIRWIGSESTGPASTATANARCQAALKGDVAALRAFAEANGKETLALEVGFVDCDGSVVGMSMVERGICQLRSVADAPNLHPANVLHYAAFAGKAEAVKYLVEECSMSKTSEGRFDGSPSEVFLSHRLMLDGSHVEDERRCPISWATRRSRFVPRRS